MKVVDASVGYKWIVPENDTDKAQSLRSEELIAPDFFPVELASAFNLAQVRGKIPDAQTALGDLLLQLPTLHESISLLPRAIEISRLTSRRSIYDLIYAALAEREGCEFVTADQKLYNSLKVQLPFVVDLASLP
jgi:predicted nucleic acid-binding protein